MQQLYDFVNDSLTDPETGWNMGSFGAIAEFHHVGDESPPDLPADLTQATTRGAIRIEQLEAVRPLAYETLSAAPHRWAQGISFCLPIGNAAMSNRKVLTELGADKQAIRAQDQDDVMFDMGLDQHQVDFCIRTSDHELIEVLRQNEGRSLFDASNPAMAAIIKTHPHRVALTRIGRVEVYQKIGGPDTAGKSPEGPHTHLLPKLLRARRTHSANTPIPEGWVPCGAIHPESPVSGRMGEDRQFDRDSFDRFQQLLKAWGSEGHLEIKNAVWQALKNRQSPDGFEEPSTRLGRSSVRNALRQWYRMHGDDGLLRRWCETFDRNPGEAGPEIPGH